MTDREAPQVQTLTDLILEDLRWRADQAVINPYGESVWLKKIPQGVTDCCFTDSPCERHEELRR